MTPVDLNKLLLKYSRDHQKHNFVSAINCLMDHMSNIEIFKNIDRLSEVVELRLQPRRCFSTSFYSSSVLKFEEDLEQLKIKIGELRVENTVSVTRTTS